MTNTSPRTVLETPTLEQIHSAMRARLELLQESEMNLADAIRDCCRSLPLGLSLRVAGHVIKWEKAQCFLHASSIAGDFSDWHVAPVFLIDGHMAPEPMVEQSKPRLSGTNTWLLDFEQTDKSWFLARTCREYKRQLDAYDNGDEEWAPDKPAPLLLCKSETMREVVPHLAREMAAWHVQRHAELAADAARNRRLSEHLQ